MRTWLLSWNPKNWEWSTFFRDRATAASNKPVAETWRCANGAATVGDAVYLVRTGEEPRGVIAHGIITRSPFDAPHYDPARAATGETTQCIGIDFNDIRDPTQDEFLSISTLEKEIDAEQAWSPQSSGIAINEGAVIKLDRSWAVLRKPILNQMRNILPEDCLVLSKYEYAPQGAWTTMPTDDKSAYRRIHVGLQQILASALSGLADGSSLDKCLTLGFNPNGGVRGNRPKDLWCAVFPRGAEAYMPQVYLIVSHRGVELGYAAAIHPKDFSNADFKSKLKSLAPRIFDALPDPALGTIKQLSETLTQQSRWYFRRTTRLVPKEIDFTSLESLLSFLKSTDGKAWGAGTVTRYWLPHELSGVNFAEEFMSAARLFQPLMVRAEPVMNTPPAEPAADNDASPISVGGEGIRGDLEKFMVMYPERRSRPFATDQELWSVVSSLQQRLKALPSIVARSSLRVTWSVGQGNWARVPWIAFADTRITDTTRSGVYGALLFREDMTGVYLTFVQGVTEPKKTHGATSALQLLREKAAALRTRCGELENNGFRLDSEIDLRTEGTLGGDYEAATIAYKLYERGELPSDNEIIHDIGALLAAYDRYLDEQQGEDAIEPDVETRPIPPSPLYTMQEALTDLFIDQQELEELLTLFRAKKNLVLQGAPGVGKTFIARRLAYLLMGRRDDARTRMVQFHQSYSYEDFIQGYRPSETGGFIRRDGAFFDFAKLAESDPDRPYVFIIDEINRGNLSKILGELMMLIEQDKRGAEYALSLAYGRPDEPLFSVPPNLFLLGVMNTADRSLALVDYALRRRFGFYKLEPQFESATFRAVLKARGVDSNLIATIADRMAALNNEIATDKVRLGPGYQIGHSFFVPTEATHLFDTAWYRRVICSEIAPLLEEYWFDDPEKAEAWTTKLLEGT
jgi:MoxR-like ATPase